jgi:hypothetical protein
MADGAVHTAKGVALEQNVRNADNLLVRMRTLAKPVALLTTDPAADGSHHYRLWCA